MTDEYKEGMLEGITCCIRVLQRALDEIKKVEGVSADVIMLSAAEAMQEWLLILNENVKKEK